MLMAGLSGLIVGQSGKSGNLNFNPRSIGSREDVVTLRSSKISSGGKRGDRDISLMKEPESLRGGEVNILGTRGFG
jgi:hypothetical protein